MKKSLELTHLDKEGSVKMVDVGEKPFSVREAKATGKITLSQDTLALIKEDKIKKGSVISVSKIAGIMAAKKCSDLIPLCHPLSLNVADVDIIQEKNGLRVNSFVSCYGKTGVEMEALTAVSTALLTIYDMCKAVDKQMVINEITLVSIIKI